MNRLAASFVSRACDAKPMVIYWPILRSVRTRRPSRR